MDNMENAEMPILHPEPWLNSPVFSVPYVICAFQNAFEKSARPEFGTCAEGALWACNTTKW
jgi:hypothetical protein